MNKEFKRMIELAGLTEIKITNPYAPLFKTNDQLAEYLKENSNYRKRLIDAIFSSPKFNRTNDPSWENVRQGWYKNPIERFGDFNDGDELMIDDGEDNRIYISVTPLNGDPSAFASFEVNLPPNEFYCEYY
jgi:hypothetical protein